MYSQKVSITAQEYPQEEAPSTQASSEGGVNKSRNGACSEAHFPTRVDGPTSTPSVGPPKRRNRFWAEKKRAKKADMTAATGITQMQPQDNLDSSLKTALLGRRGLPRGSTCSTEKKATE